MPSNVRRYTKQLQDNFATDTYDESTALKQGSVFSAMDPAGADPGHYGMLRQENYPLGPPNVRHGGLRIAESNLAHQIDGQPRTGNDVAWTSWLPYRQEPLNDALNERQLRIQRKVKEQLDRKSLNARRSKEAKVWRSITLPEGVNQKTFGRGSLKQLPQEIQPIDTEWRANKRELAPGR